MVIDRSDAADARRFRHLLAGNGYYMEEQMLCGHWPTSTIERDNCRKKIDEQIENTKDELCQVCGGDHTSDDHCRQCICESDPHHHPAAEQGDRDQ